MHQTFYIDIDEEITSIIDRLRKSRAKDNVIVIPKKALFLQSLVNLKLLKKEADKAKKRILIVSQDGYINSLAEKIGIPIQESMEGIEPKEEIREDLRPTMNDREKRGKAKKKKDRLSEIGTSDYSDNNIEIGNERRGAKSIAGGIKNIPTTNNDEENIVNKELIRSVDMKRRPSSIVDVKKGRKKEKIFFEENNNLSFSGDKIDKKSDNKNYLLEKDFDDIFHSKSKFDNYNQVSKSIKKGVSVGIGRVALIFSVSCIVVFSLIGSYLFLPKAEINVVLKKNQAESDFDVMANTNILSVNFDDNSIPARFIEKEKEISRSFSSTDSGDSSNSKARGKVVIYNEYNTSPQTLVATTRLLTRDGKMFRLIKGVTVPGVIVDGGKSRAGEVEVDVIADQAGGDFNIGPSDFSIPGFSGSPKYEKIYAKSSQPMTGGGLSNGVVKIISQADIEKARVETESAAIQDLVSEIKQGLKDDEVLVEDAIEKNIEKSLSSHQAGVAIGKFDYLVKVKVKTIIFSESDIKKIAILKFKEGGNDIDVDDNSIKIKYGKSTMDYGSGLLRLKISTDASIYSDVSEDGLRDEFAGKNKQQLIDAVKKFPQIEEIEIVFKPSFFEKVPNRKSRIEISIKR